MGYIRWDIHWGHGVWGHTNIQSELYMECNNTQNNKKRIVVSAAYAQLRSLAKKKKRKAKKRRNKRGVRAMFSHQTKPKKQKEKTNKGSDRPIGGQSNRGKACFF